MRFPTIALLTVVAALTLFSVATPHSNAQSIPPGQASRRMVSIAPKALVLTTPTAVQATHANNQAQAEMVIQTPPTAPASGCLPTMLGPQTANPPAAPEATALADEFDSKTSDSDQDCYNKSFGSARQAAWTAVLQMDLQPSTYSMLAMNGARMVANAVPDWVDIKTAQVVARTAKIEAVNRLTSGESAAAQAADQQAIAAAADVVIALIVKQRCGFNGSSSDATITTPLLQYQYRSWAPTWGPGCTDDAIRHFFSVNKNLIGPNNVQYLYNAEQSESQANADLLTATFSPGIQVVLAGTTTAGSAQSTGTTSGGSSGGSSGGTSDAIRRQDSSGSSTTTTSTTTTDSVATAVSKLQQGGNFNIRVPAPFYFRALPHGSLEGIFSPNLGVDLSGLGSQNNITQATNFSENLPLELFFQTNSIDFSNGTSVGSAFLDLKPAGEFISSKLAQAIGPSVPKAFFLGQAAAGFEFSNNIRFSLQYIWGNAKIYQSASGIATGTSATPTSSIGGFHIAVSFSPQNSKSSSQ